MQEFDEWVSSTGEHRDGIPFMAPEMLLEWINGVLSVSIEPVVDVADVVIGGRVFGFELRKGVHEFIYTLGQTMDVTILGCSLVCLLYSFSSGITDLMIFGLGLLGKESGSHCIQPLLPSPGFWHLAYLSHF